LPAKLITVALLPGLHKTAYSGNGNPLVPFCGSMAHVRVSPSHPSVRLTRSNISAGSGKTIISYVSLQLLSTGRAHVVDSSRITEDIQAITLTGLAILVIFYFDFRDTAKQNPRNMLSSILVQLCQQSDRFSEVLSSVCSTHGDGSREPSMDVLLGCLKAMVALPGQGTLYVVLDALDECPNSTGLPTRRQQVLAIVKGLIDLKLPNLRFCITSRPEIDIQEVFDPLSPYQVALHDQIGQIKDLAQYVESVVHSDSAMRKWPEEVKKSVIDSLVLNGAGMYVTMTMIPCITSHAMTPGFGGRTASWKRCVGVLCARFHVL